MTVRLDSQVTSPEIAAIFEKAIWKGLRYAAEDTPWEVTIAQPEEGAEYVLELLGPEGFRWSHCFFGPAEVDSQFISGKVINALESCRELGKSRSSEQFQGSTRLREDSDQNSN